MNPFKQQPHTPHSTLPFSQFTPKAIEEAIAEGIEEENHQINSLTGNVDTPTFSNTIEVMERGGRLLAKASCVLSNLLSAETSDELDEVAERVTPLMANHANDYYQNADLFKRVKAVKESKEQLTTEQQTVLDNYFRSFSDSGSLLSDADKDEFRKISVEESQLSLQFSQNKLKDLNAYTLHVTDRQRLEGLPESVMQTAAEEAATRGKEGWVFTLHAPSYRPFLTYCRDRALRHDIYMAYNTLCCHGNDNDNTEICRRLVNLRLRQAQLLGYACYADHVLEDRMAENTRQVYDLLHQLLQAYKPRAEKELEAVRKEAKHDMGEDFDLQPWDLSYYSNKLKERLFHINSEMPRPYFQLEKVQEGVFGLAHRLYGITLVRNADIPVYHPDVVAYDVKDSDGSYLGVLYCDFFPRKSKKAGAWMTNYQEQEIDAATGEDIRPHVSLVMNFSRPTSDKPSLLTLDEVETFLHEFGHSLHSLLTRCHYPSVSGTNVKWDFVELPSQFMENYATNAEFLHTFATHYESGAPIPDELVKKIQDSRNFHAGLNCLPQVEYGLLDMALHTITRPLEGDIADFERQARSAAHLMPFTEGTCMTTQFSHIMAGGYSAGYYSYKWAEVLDADAFEQFQQSGIFNTDTARRFRDNILAKGGTEHPMTLYKRFRGGKPTIDALLRRNGIITNNKPSTQP